MSAAYLLFSGEISVESAIRFQQELADIWLHDSTELHLAFNSLGGITSEGHAMANMLKAFADIRLITYNVGRIESAATLPYLIGSDRVCAPDSLFMVHPPKQYINAHCTAVILEGQLRIQRQIEQAYLGEVIHRTNMPADKAAEMAIHEVHFHAEDAVSCGIAHRIGAFAIPPGAQLRVIGGAPQQEPQ